MSLVHLLLRHARQTPERTAIFYGIDPTAPQSGLTQAQVLVTGAQGLIPERAAPYEVRLEWRYVSDDWKLTRLTWE